MTNYNDSEQRPWETLKNLAGAGETHKLEEFIGTLEPREAVRAILRLEEPDQRRILTTLSPAEAADLIEDVPDEQAASLIENLPVDNAAAIVSEMQSDEQADVLGDLEAGDAEAILAEMEPEEADGARRLVAYDDDVAGGLMITEFLQFGEGISAGEVIEAISARSESEDEYFGQYVYVVSEWNRLVGVLSVSNLVLSRRAAPIANIMVPPLFMKAEATIDALKTFFDRHSFSGMPITDDHGHLIGVVTRAAVSEAIARRADHDSLRMQGIVGGDEIRTLPVLTRARRRLAWLSINIVLNIIAASVIAFYLDTLQAVIALAVFLPIISDMSGCSGNQAVAVSMRELSLGLTKPFEVVRIWIQEILVGLINGLALGCLLGVVAWLWKGEIYLAIVVGAALAMNTLISVSIGGTVPLILKRMGVDPAVASGPILTTVTDMCGFFLVLSFATFALSYLTIR